MTIPIALPMSVSVQGTPAAISCTGATVNVLPQFWQKLAS